MPRFPGPHSQRLLHELGRYVIADPQPFVVDVAASQGMWLATVDGDRIFDWAGYYGSKLLSHNHPCLQEPQYQEQLLIAANNKVPNPDFLTPACLAYYRLLHELAPRCMRGETLEVYVVNSGAEAVENMMKYLINLHAEKMRAAGKQPLARRFIYFDRAFHGRTIGALNVTNLGHDPIVTKDFHEFIPGNIRVPFPHVDNSRPEAENDGEIRQTIDIVERCLARYRDEVVGIILEPIQGAGGHRMARPAFFQRLSELAAEYEVGLAFDEVQTAGGQCGAVFAIDCLALPHPPDAVAVAKKFGNGAIFMKRPMVDYGVLDSTWGGSLTDMVRFVQEMMFVRRADLIRKVQPKTDLLVAGLGELQERFPGLIFNVRGLGLYQGFSLRNPEHKHRLIEQALEEESLLLLGAGAQTIRLRPPLDVSEADISLFLEMLQRRLAALAA